LGNLVFETEDNVIKWDGQLNNQPASKGIYVWTLQYQGYNAQGETIRARKKGHIQLIR